MKSNEELKAELEILQYKVDKALEIISKQLAEAEKDKATNTGRGGDSDVYYYAEGKRIICEFVQNILK